MHRDTAVSCTCSRPLVEFCMCSCLCTCTNTVGGGGGVRKASMSFLLPSVCANLKDCDACLWMCVHVYILLLFVLFGTFNPLGHISELKNFRADIAF